MQMATAASTEADREIVVSRIIDGPRRLVFDAFTSPTHLAQWCTPKGGKITTNSFDFKPDGVWDATIQGPDGSAYPNHWTWKEIVPPERIVWLYGMSKDDPHPVKSSLTLAERGATTEATLRLVFGSKEERDEKVAKYYAKQGAQQSLNALAGYVATLARS
jgi:uncharacterized protein YndB with AHSA1/START domain